MHPASVPEGSLEGSVLSPLGAEASGGQKNNGNEHQRQNGDLTKIRRQNKTMGILQNLIRTRKRAEIGQTGFKNYTSCHHCHHVDFAPSFQQF